MSKEKKEKNQGYLFFLFFKLNSGLVWSVGLLVDMRQTEKEVTEGEGRERYWRVLF